jgi:prepilin-type N-terminal cleavage/methylation domain-containing protein
MRTDGLSFRAAYTLVEILIVILVMAIAAAIVIPNIGSANDSQAIAAAAILQSDLEVARSMAMATQAPYSVVFSPDRQSYKVIANYAGTAYASTTAVAHPVNKGKLYEVCLSSLNGMSHVSVTSVVFGGQQYVTFLSLGQPNAGGSVVLTVGRITMTVSVEALTGIVSVTRVGT